MTLFTIGLVLLVQAESLLYFCATGSTIHHLECPLFVFDRFIKLELIMRR